MRLTRIALLLLLASPCYAGPKKLVQSIGHEVKMTFVDMHRHPYAWGLWAGLQTGIAFSDTASSCMAPGVEVGGAHYFVGRHPACHKFVLLTSGMMFTHLVAEHALSNLWLQSCQRDAAKADGRWNRIDAHTHNPESCRWTVPVADTIGLAAWEIPGIKSNIDELERK